MLTLEQIEKHTDIFIHQQLIDVFDSREGYKLRLKYLEGSKLCRLAYIGIGEYDWQGFKDFINQTKDIEESQLLGETPLRQYELGSFIVFFQDTQRIEDVDVQGNIRKLQDIILEAAVKLP